MVSKTIDVGSIPTAPVFLKNVKNAKKADNHAGFQLFLFLDNTKIEWAKTGKNTTRCNTKCNTIFTVYGVLNSDLSAASGTRFRYGVTDDGKPGYIITDTAGADAVIPFEDVRVVSKTTSIGVSNGTTLTFDISADYPQYAQLTIDNIYIEIVAMWYMMNGYGSFTKSYDPQTGIVTLVKLFQ